MTGSSPEGIELSMPTFTERSDNQLNQTLSTMGTTRVFLQADFTNITA